MKKEIYEKIISKKEFSQLPEKDVEFAWNHFEKREVGDEEKIRLTRDLLRKVFSVFTSSKLLNVKISDKKSAEEILKKHISTRERFDFYGEVYRRLLKNYSNLTIFDLGCGVNGFSYGFFPKNTIYIGIEAIGQLVDLQNYYFEKNNLNGKCYHLSLFELAKLKKYLKQDVSSQINLLPFGSKLPISN
ncbi:hypothetical protein ACFL0X_02530, partial [Nanoarchaeota archaeon]